MRSIEPSVTGKAARQPTGRLVMPMTALTQRLFMPAGEWKDLPKQIFRSFIVLTLTDAEKLFRQPGPPHRIVWFAGCIAPKGNIA
jgi:hypothetical protein